MERVQVDAQQSALRKWARETLDDATWDMFLASREELQMQRDVNGLERADSSDAPHYRSLPMRKKAATQMITTFHKQLQELRERETEARAHAERELSQIEHGEQAAEMERARVEEQIMQLHRTLSGRSLE